MGTGLFFPSEGDLLYGFLHPAEGGPRRTGVLFVHGAFEERQDAHLPLRHVAEMLAAKGYHVFRFDLYGHGDSAGEFEDATLDRWVEDTVHAAHALRERSGCDQIVLVGLRLGAIIAARAAARLEGITSRLALWQPVVDGRTYVMDVLRSFLASEMVMHRRSGVTRDALIDRLRAGRSVNIFGYALSPAMFEGLCNADLATDLAGSTARVLLLEMVRNINAQGSASLDELAQALGDRAELQRVVEAQPIHAEGKLFINRAPAATDATLRFLETVA